MNARNISNIIIQLVVSFLTDRSQFVKMLEKWSSAHQSLNCAGLIIILIMLASLYCAAYTRMTMNESFPPCEQRRITFNDDGQRVQLVRPRVTSATLHLHIQAATNYIPHHRLGIITPDLLPEPIYRPRKDG